MTFGATFLESPDLFPARPGGEPWGDIALRLDLAGGPYRLEGLIAGQEAVLRERLGERILGQEEPEEGEDGGEVVEVRLFRAASSDFLDFDRTGREITVDRRYEPRDVGLAGWRFMGRLDWRPGLCGALWTSLSEGPELQGVFENFLRVLVAYRLLEFGGALIHSAAVVESGAESGAVHLFLGPSGAGKTTMGRLALAAGREVLSDDMNAVTRTSGGSSQGFQVERLPFAGDLGQTAVRGERFPLAGLHRLEQGPAIRIAPLSPARALAALLACCPFVNADPHRREALERNLETVLGAIPLDRLTFPREGPFEEIAATITTRYRLASDVRFRVVGGEGVVVRQDAGEVLVVNGVAARILELLDPRRGAEGPPEGRGLEELIDRLTEEYEAPRDEIESDVREFLKETLAGGVVETG